MDKSVGTYTAGLKHQGLSEEEHSENALLRSRIDEQSQLIMILKQRADESLAATKAAEKRYSTLETERLQLLQDLEQTVKRCNMLDARFNDLASNHQQMIEFKDEYKRQNAELLAENDRLRSENARMFSAAIEERNATIADLQKANHDLEKKLALAQLRHRESVTLCEQLKAENRQEMKRIQYEIDITEKKLLQTEKDLEDTRKRLQQAMESSSNIDAETRTTIDKLTRERNEFSELSMSRGRAIQEKQAENIALQKKLESAEKAVKDLQAKHEREAAAVSVDKEVQRLKKCIVEEQAKYKSLVQEFEVFKNHSKSMLEQERQLNEKLRHLSM